ncbi:NAD(+) diphosphatase [Ancylobacter amanitiformis]|uniref:NAD(+) diphosphatase n=1 Tax=Ancylobacter amanitiformis TaxID=217069 RepID=A0ABU0LTB2_9HYPH|nr:NAD(+) diphosphatase [Ancylobacter amanitiformis]MDQ0511957.1 NAD+ diphosphatase [Ancylobacter amanitiformis]
MATSERIAGELGCWPHLGYVGSRLDRASERRAETPDMLRDTRALACLVAGESVVLRRLPGTTGDDEAGGFEALIDLGRAVALGGRVSEACLLGLADGVPHFVLPLHAASLAALAEAPDLRVTDLRSVAVGEWVSAEELGELATAKAMIAWHARRTFCSNCAHRLHVAEGGWRRECPECGAQHFPRTDPVVIMLTHDGDNCLLGRSPRFAPGMWSCLAGFVEPGETFEEAVRRETMEEAGIRTGAVRYVASQPWPFPMSVMIGTHAQALSREITIDANELEAARWFSRKEAKLLLTRTHPDGLIAPPRMAIAHHLIRAFVEGRDPPAG